MKKLFKVRFITAIMFVVMLFVFSIVNLYYSYPSVLEAFEKGMDENSSISEIVSGVETSMNENIVLKYTLLEVYGTVQQVLGKNEMNDFEIVKDEQGYLHYSYFDDGVNDVSSYIEQTLYLSEALEEEGTPFVHIITPVKNIRGFTTFEEGTPIPYDNEVLDAFIEGLDENDISYLDLRSLLYFSDLDVSEWFYMSDHHWTIQTAFWGFSTIVTYLEETFEEVIDEESFYTDIDNYNQIVYEDSFVGSLGRETGMVYSGIDDFTLILPSFYTDYTCTISDLVDFELVKSGTFEMALMDVTPFNTTAYLLDTEAQKYFSYLMGNHAFVSIENNKIEDGLKVLIIKDSFAVPLASFLSTTCSQVDLIDPRYIEGDIDEYVLGNDYDYVFSLFSAPNYTDEFFTYGE